MRFDKNKCRQPKKQRECDKLETLRRLQSEKKELEKELSNIENIIRGQSVYIGLIKWSDSEDWGYKNRDQCARGFFRKIENSIDTGKMDAIKELIEWLNSVVVQSEKQAPFKLRLTQVKRYINELKTELGIES